jgi:hypothetical protein
VATVLGRVDRVDAIRRVATVRLVCVGSRARTAGEWNGRLAPSHEFIFHFNRVAERARKTKDKLPENIEVTRGNRGGMRRKDGSVTGRSNPEAGLHARKIPDSVVRVMRHKARDIEVAHPAVFPVDIVSEMLGAFSDPGDLAFEPFCGSGTQLIAADRDGRRCYATEIAPAYVDVAVIRWSKFTGRPAVLADDGRTFDEAFLPLQLLAMSHEKGPLQRRRIGLTGRAPRPLPNP